MRLLKWYMYVSYTRGREWWFNWWISIWPLNYVTHCSWKTIICTSVVCISPFIVSRNSPGFHGILWRCGWFLPQYLHWVQFLTNSMDFNPLSKLRTPLAFKDSKSGVYAVGKQTPWPHCRHESICHQRTVSDNQQKPKKLMYAEIWLGKNYIECKMHSDS